MNQFIDHYAILSVSLNATSKEIDDAYKKQCLKWHPDRNQRIDTTKQMQEINEAKRILTDKRLRDKYNKLYQSRCNSSINQRPQQSKTTDKESTKLNGNYVCNLKTDEELIRICANAAKYNFEFIHAVLQELKTRKYTLETISRIVRQTAKR